MTFPILPSNNPVGGYQVQRSLRFNSADSAYLNRTFATPTNNKVFTYSFWVKMSRAGSATDQFRFLDAGLNNFDRSIIGNTATGAFSFIEAIAGAYQSATTVAVFRDLSAWYHVVFSVDTTQAVDVNRVKIYVNGVNQSTTTNVTQNLSPRINSAVVHNISRDVGIPTAGFLSGYMTEVNFIDGQALTPSSFGETNATTGQWQPKQYTGTYGTNGFYLNFSDNSGTTATTLGKDYSGNGNNWTPNNFSVTAGAGNDSMIDVPTNWDDGGNGRGNYCTLNPLDKTTTATLSNGNLEFATSTTNHSAVATFGMSSGQWYWEAQTSAGTTETRAGVYGTSASTLYSFAANNTVYGFRFDADTGALDYTTNGSSWTALATGLISGPYFVYLNNNGATSKTITANFGQRPFAYTPPSGFKALNTQDIAAGTITTSGSFTGNVNADGPFVWLNGVPTTMTINGNAVTFGTHADKLANGFKVRTASTSYNNTGSNTYSITTTGATFKVANAQGNP